VGRGARRRVGGPAAARRAAAGPARVRAVHAGGDAQQRGDQEEERSHSHRGPHGIRTQRAAFSAVVFHGIEWPEPGPSTHADEYTGAPPSPAVAELAVGVLLQKRGVFPLSIQRATLGNTRRSKEGCERTSTIVTSSFTVGRRHPDVY